MQSVSKVNAFYRVCVVDSVGCFKVIFDYFIKFIYDFIFTHFIYCMVFKKKNLDLYLR